MDTNEELVEHLNQLEIVQTLFWEGDIPENIWNEYFKDKHKEVAKELNIKHIRDWALYHQLSTTVIEINNGFIGIESVTLYNDENSFSNIEHKLKFFEMEETPCITYTEKKTGHEWRFGHYWRI